MPTPYRRNAKTPAGRISATPSTANWGGLRKLLAQYPGASAAYSLRSIGSNPVVQLRRASDNVEKDFTATELTDGTAETWASSGDAFIRYWYDQSGNGNNAGQSTAAEQPKLISSGSIINENGKPAIDFSGGNFHFDSLSVSLTGDNSTFAVTNFNDSSSALLGYSTGYCRSRVANQIRWRFSRNNYDFANVELTGQGVFSFHRSGTDGTVFRNNSASTSNPITVNTNTILVQEIGSTGGTFEHSGTIQEIIIYPSDQSANRVGIETNINDYYGIY